MPDGYAEYEDQIARTQRKAFFRWLTKDEAAKLPARSDAGHTRDDWLNDGNEFDMVIVDRRSGREYACKYSMPIVSTLGDGSEVAFENAEWEEEERFVVQPYFVYWHFCGCHRVGSLVITDGQAWDDTATDEECPANRYLVKSMTHRGLPGVSLYYEEAVGEFAGSLG